MKTTRILATMLLVALSWSAHAVPVAYEFSGEITGGSGPFAVGTQLVANFDYDASTAPINTDVDGGDISAGFAPYGFFSIYIGAVTNFSAAIDGSNFGNDVSATFVGDGAGDPASGIFNSANRTASGWIDLTVSGFELLRYSMYTVGGSDMLADQSLPTTLPYYEDIPFGANTGLNMVFRDAAGSIHVQNIWGNAGGNVSLGPVSVPEPATIVLLGLGLLMLASRRRMALARISR